MGAEEEDALSGSGGCVACSNWLDDEAVVSSGKVGVKVGIGFLLLPLAFEMARRWAVSSISLALSGPSFDEGITVRVGQEEAIFLL